MIHNQIQEAQVNFEVRTGRKPVNVYLGRNQMTALLKWAKENEYISDVSKEKIEGNRRPEVGGLLAYEVNDNDHINFA